MPQALAMAHNNVNLALLVCAVCSGRLLCATIQRAHEGVKRSDPRGLGSGCTASHWCFFTAPT